MAEKGPSRKRTKTPENWKRNIRKIARNQVKCYSLNFILKLFIGEFC